MNTENNYTETDLGNVSPNPRGEFSEAEEYEYLDLVSFEGGSYLCKAEPGTVIIGFSPGKGANNDYWQVITIPGNLTPEYVAAHDRVVNLAEQVEADAEEVREAKENIEGMEANVQTLQEQAAESAGAAEQSKTEAAGYASAADASRQGAAESEVNTNALVSGFDAHVADKTEEAEENITQARQTAIGAITTQQAQSIQAVKDQAATEQAKAEAYTAQSQAAAENALQSERNAKSSETAASQSAANAEAAARQAGEYANQAETDKSAVEQAKVAIAQLSQEVEDNKESVDQAVEAFKQTRQQAVTDVNTAGAAQIKAVGDTGAEQITAVTQEGTTQVQNVQQAAAEIIADREQIEINRQNLLKTAIKRTASGKIITFSDSAEMPLVGLRQYGRTDQGSTTGANLCNWRDYPTTEQNGVTLTADSKGVVTLKGTPTAASDFRFTLFCDVDLSLLEVGNTYRSNIGLQIHRGEALSYGAFEFTDDITRVRTYVQRNVNTYVDGEVIKPMLNAGSTVLPWEPYTGGIPSPSPDYPQELVSAGDKGSIEVDVFGGNLLDIKKIPDSSANGVTLQNNGDGTLTVSGTTTDNYFTSNRINNLVLPDGEYTFTVDEKLNEGVQVIIGNKLHDGTIKYNIITSKNQSMLVTIDNSQIKAITFWIQVMPGYTVNSTFRVMLNAGTVALPWEPYNKQTLLHTTPNGLPGIPVASGGNYTDENGQQWIADYRDWDRGVDVQRVEKHIFDGTENFVLHNANTDIYSFGYKNIEWKSESGGLCNYFSQKTDDVTDNSFWLASLSRNTTALFKYRALKSLDEWKDWVKMKYDEGNPLIFMAELSTPIETPIPAAELAAYHALHTNHPNTTIYNDEDCWMEVEYATETKDYIDNEIAKTAVALGGLSFGITDNGLLRVSWEEEGN